MRDSRRDFSGRGGAASDLFGALGHIHVAPKPEVDSVTHDRPSLIQAGHSESKMG